MSAARGDTPVGRVLMVVENAPIPTDLRVFREASALRDAGYEVSIISPKGWGFTRGREMVDGIAVFRHPHLEGASLLGHLAEYVNATFWELVLALRVRRERGVDVIHLANPPDVLFLVAALLKPLGAQVVFDQHDLGPELFEVKFGRHGRGTRVLLALERLSFRVADVSIATNDSYRQLAIERGEMAPEDVFVVRNGPDLTEVAPTDPRDLHGGRRHLVVFAGSMERQDGVGLLLDAARTLLDQRDDVRFVVAGPGAELAPMRAKATAMGIADHVVFTGKIPHSEVLGIIEQADVCVSPDGKNPLNDRSTMVKVLEYMAAGKPVVQFDLHEGHVSAGEAALYAEGNDPADLAAKIAALLDDPVRRERMGRVGRRRIETELAWQHQVPRLLAAYERLGEKRAAHLAGAS